MVATNTTSTVSAAKLSIVIQMSLLPGQLSLLLINGQIYPHCLCHHCLSILHEAMKQERSQSTFLLSIKAQLMVSSGPLTWCRTRTGASHMWLPQTGASFFNLYFAKLILSSEKDAAAFVFKIDPFSTVLIPNWPIVDCEWQSTAEWPRKIRKKAKTVEKIKKMTLILVSFGRHAQANRVCVRCAWPELYSSEEEWKAVRVTFDPATIGADSPSELGGHGRRRHALSSIASPLWRWLLHSAESGQSCGPSDEHTAKNRDRRGKRCPRCHLCPLEEVLTSLE